MRLYLLTLSCLFLTQATLSYAVCLEKPTEFVRGSNVLKITFMGNTTLIFEDGLSTFVLDGFVSRSKKRQLIWRYKAKPRVEDVFKSLGICKVDMVTTLHTHYDHAQDVPEIMQRFQPKLIGSSSLQHLVCRAKNESPCSEQLPITKGKIGDFEIELEPATHSRPRGWLRKKIQRFAAPLGGRAENYPKENTPKVLPTAGFRWSRYWVEGQSYNVAIRHRDKVFYVYGGKPDELQSKLMRDANVIFVAVPAYPIEAQDAKANEAFWHVLNQDFVGVPNKVKLIIPVHWDDFTKPIPRVFKNRKLRPLTGFGAKSINVGLQALFDDMCKQNAKYDKNRFAYYQPKMFAEQIDLPSTFPAGSGSDEVTCSETSSSK